VILDLGQIPEDALPDALAGLEQKVGRNRICLALPTINRALPRSRDWPALLKQLFAQGWRRWQISNLGGLEMLAAAGAVPGNAWLSADWPLYACNQAAVQAALELGLRRLTLSPEDIFSNWSALLGKLSDYLQVMAYSDVPLAISAVCANASRLGHCPGPKNCDFSEFSLISRKNDHLLAINNDCQSVYLHKRPFNLGGRLAELRQHGARFFRADFLWRNYAPTAVKAIWDELQADRPNDQNWSAHLFTPQ